MTIQNSIAGNKEEFTFDFVPAHLIAPEIAPNVARHHREMRDYGEGHRLNIDWESYLAAGLQGSCMVATMRHGGVLVGYSIYFIQPNPRHKHITEATGEGLVIEKEHRGRMFRSFQEKAEQFLKSYGAQTVNYLSGSESVGRLMRQCGLKPQFTIWSKEL